MLSHQFHMIRLKRLTIYTVLSAALFVWLFSFAFTASASRAGFNDPSFQTASEFINKGMFLQAVSTYTEIVNRSTIPNTRARALLFMAGTYNRYLNQYDPALKLYRKILKHYPNSPSAEDALFNIGTILNERCRYKDAHSVFVTFAQRFPHSMRKASADFWADDTHRKAQTHGSELNPSIFLNISDTRIRVLVKDGTQQFRVNAVGAMTVSDPDSGAILFTGPGPLLFSKTGRHIELNGQPLPVNHCRIESKGRLIRLDSSGFRGWLEIFPDVGGLQAVNHVPLEKYLYGVVPKEMSSDWAEEALKAQAIASRTYALYIKSKNTDRPYDVLSSTGSQVYGGCDAEHSVTTAAVNATRGQVMIHEGHLIIACFHADSGGYTEDPRHVWSAEIPYLKSISDTFSGPVEQSSWQYFITRDELRNKLFNIDIEAGEIQRIIPVEKSPSGRIVRIGIITLKGAVELTGNNFRTAVGPKLIKSTFFDILSTKKGFIFKGQGYGHGVGMSQSGAERMARAGYNCHKILQHYYQQIRFVTINRP